MDMSVEELREGFVKALDSRPGDLACTKCGGRANFDGTDFWCRDCETVLFFDETMGSLTKEEHKRVMNLLISEWGL